MISKMTKIITMLVCFFPALALANTGESVGYWAVKCGGFGGSIEISASNEAKININDNNLYISAGLVKDSNSKSQVFYRNVIESTNDKINWEEISKNKPIAELSIEDGIIHMAWKGFFDVKKKAYIWKVEPDFIVASGGNVNVEMKRCDF